MIEWEGTRPMNKPISYKAKLAIITTKIPNHSIALVMDCYSKGIERMLKEPNEPDSIYYEIIDRLYRITNRKRTNAIQRS